MPHITCLKMVYKKHTNWLYFWLYGSKKIFLSGGENSAISALRIIPVHMCIHYQCHTTGILVWDTENNSFIGDEIGKERRQEDSFTYKVGT